MRAATIWDIEASTPESNLYSAEGGKILFGDFSVVCPKIIEVSQGGFNTFKEPQNASTLPFWDDYAKMGAGAVSYAVIGTPREADREFMIAAGDWPTADSDWLADLQDTPFTRSSYGIGDTSFLLERTLSSTATNVLTPDTLGQVAYHISYDAGKAYIARHLLDAALRRHVTIVLVADHDSDPVPKETLSALNAIKNLPDNWDGDGTSRIDVATVAKAERLIRQAFLTSPRRLMPPSVAPGFGGMIVAEWSGPTGIELILDIPPGDDPPGFLLVELSPEGDELETDDQLGHSWSIRDLIARLIPD